jgi:hypothetical protein
MPVWWKLLWKLLLAVLVVAVFFLWFQAEV